MLLNSVVKTFQVLASALSLKSCSVVLTSTFSLHKVSTIVGLKELRENTVTQY